MAGVAGLLCACGPRAAALPGCLPREGGLEAAHSSWKGEEGIPPSDWLGGWPSACLPGPHLPPREKKQLIGPSPLWTFTAPVPHPICALSLLLSQFPSYALSPPSLLTCLQNLPPPFGVGRKQEKGSGRPGSELLVKASAQDSFRPGHGW